MVAVVKSSRPPVVAVAVWVPVVQVDVPPESVSVNVILLPTDTASIRVPVGVPARGRAAVRSLVKCFSMCDVGAASGTGLAAWQATLSAPLTAVATLFSVAMGAVANLATRMAVLVIAAAIIAVSLMVLY